MANPEHIEILKQGVEAWNQWRKDHPDVTPDLSGTEEEPFVFAEVFKDSAVWGKLSMVGEQRVYQGLVLDDIDLSGADLRCANLSGADLQRANLSGANFQRAILNRAFLVRTDLSHADLEYADLSRAALWSANLSQATLSNADLSGATLGDANLSGAKLEHADLSGVNLRHAILNGAKLAQTTLTDADFSGSDVADADFTRVVWRPGKRFRRAPGQGLPSLRNNPGLQRFWSDELYIDAQRAQLEGAEPQTRRDHFAIHRPLRKPEWIILALLGALIGVVAGGPEQLSELHGGAYWSGLQAQSTRADVCRAVFSGAVVGALLGLFFCAYWGRRLVFMLWGLFDYGRSWPAVALLALMLITLFGLAYSLWLVPGEHMQWSGSDRGEDHWFYPWFVAAMGFATLGIADVAKPVTGVGQLMMMANVLAGFTTFGLLLSVLGNTFARRAG